MNCPHCHSPKTQKDDQRQLHTGQRVQGYRCTAGKKRFNERTGTPMSRLRTPQAVVEVALKARSEGNGYEPLLGYWTSHITVFATGNRDGLPKSRSGRRPQVLKPK